MQYVVVWQGLYNRLFCCNHTCNCVNMVSVTSATRYKASAPRYHRVIKLVPRCTTVVWFHGISRNWPWQFRLCSWPDSYFVSESEDRFSHVGALMVYLVSFKYFKSCFAWFCFLVFWYFECRLYGGDPGFFAHGNYCTCWYLEKATPESYCMVCGYLFVCLFDFILYVHSTIFQLCGTVLPGLNQY